METIHDATDGETYYWSEEETTVQSKDVITYKLMREDDHEDDDVDVHQSRLPLRRKKSSMQYSESNGGADDKNVPTCVECGKTFTSSKALYGHLRCHPSRGYRGANPPPAPAAAPTSGVSDGPRSLPAAKTWSVTARRGRKGTFSEFQGRELAAVKLLLLFSESKVHDQHSAPPAANRRTSYTCTTCNQTFASHQALGGHRANHSKQKELEVMGMLEKAKMVESNSAMATSMAASAAAAAAAAAAHRCKICNMTFATGQALGGHKRKHRKNPSLSSVLEISKRNQ